ncbi:MAG: AmmeMemoRadiSam system protein B [Candidatus Sumerlaeia bacterium]|nr:AmmeMemoRadiSam system protein B [Candidatus Sumerlaeia bacterium]
MFDNITTFPLETPALRPLEIVPVQSEGRQLIMVRDPMGLIEGAALLMPDPILMVFLQMADGKTQLGDMAQKLTEATGQIIPVGMFERLVKELDNALMLQSDRFAEALRERYREFMESPTRPYRVFQAEGNDRLKMMKELGDEFRRHEMSPYSPPKEMELPEGGVTAVLSPHIDYNRGGETYAWSYKALKEYGTGAKTYIVLGTTHRPSSHRFVATKKDYDTPFGVIKTDTALLDELEKEFGGDLYGDEYLHADEHTVELQAVYLKKTFGDSDIRMIPILVDSFSDLIMAGVSPTEDPEVGAFIKALRTILERHGDDVALIGGVDFSHCGPEFGHEQPNEDDRVKEIENEDRAVLKHVEALDPEAYFAAYHEDQNARNHCSMGAVYTVMETMKGRAEAKLLNYQQANSAEKSNLVSFASVAFTKPGMEPGKKAKIILL